VAAFSLGAWVRGRVPRISDYPRAALIEQHLTAFAPALHHRAALRASFAALAFVQSHLLLRTSPQFSRAATRMPDYASLYLRHWNILLKCD